MKFKTIDPSRLEEMTAWVEKYPEKAAREIMINRGLSKTTLSVPKPKITGSNPFPPPGQRPPPPKGPGPRDPRGKR